MADILNVYDEFTTSMQALWAGDLQFARRGLERISNAEELLDERGPTDVIRKRANAQWELLEEEKVSAPPEESVLKTTNLRGLFTRTSERGFEMRAFLLNPDWDEDLLINAAERAAVHRRNKSRETPKAGAALGFVADPTPHWIEQTDDAIMEVAVSEFGLIRARLTWIGVFPNNLRPLRDAFKAVLEGIDPVAP